MYKISFLLVVLALCHTTASAQQFGGTPADIKWKQINNDTLRIIYPKGLDSIAQRVAALAGYEQRNHSQTLGSGVHKINIVLRNELTYFNGYVGLGPYRSEYYLLPQQNALELGAQSAADMLAVHEYRHVEQYNNFRKGLSKFAYTLFGQNGQALANGASVPDWFFEGDAVYNETMLTEQGRGRLPYFFNGYRSLFMEGKQYNFMKLRNGSFKDFVPNHYPLGYMLVAYGREKYGADIWGKITNDAVSFKPLIYPLQGAIKKYTSISYQQFVSDAFDYYKNEWQQEKTPAITWLTATQNRNVVNYKYPYKYGNNSVLVLKNSYKKLAAFYIVDANGNEQRIKQQGITNDDYFSYNHNTIVYAAYQPNTRWDYREYSIIKVLDIATGAEKNITTHTKYYAPDISHDGSLLAAAAVTPGQQSSLDVLDMQGKKLYSLTNTKNLVYSYPKFANDDASVFVMVRTTTGLMSLQQWNFKSNETAVLLPFSNKLLNYPAVEGDTLLYTCTNNGKDEAWAYVSKENKHYKLADYPTGLYQSVMAGGGKIVSSVFTAEGYRLGSLATAWQPTNTGDTLKGLYVSKPFNTSANGTLLQVPQTDFYPTKKYGKFTHPINFHSLQPDYSDPLFTLTLYGENVLSTMQNQVYYVYNTNERYSQVGYDIIYGGWFLQPFIDISGTFNRHAVSASGNNINTFNEYNVGAGLRLPLNLSGGKQYRNLTTQASYNYKSLQYTGSSKEEANNASNGYAEARLTYTGQKQQAVQHIYPHWAQTFIAQYRNITGGNKEKQLLLTGSLFLPAILPSHSIVISAGYQVRDTLNNFKANRYSFPNNFPISRDYLGYDYPEMFKIGANYHLPLAYPDFGFGNIVYFKRVRANLFYDYTQLRLKTTNGIEKHSLQSTGAELYFDTRWWNQEAITFGIRYSRLLDHESTGQQANQWTIILPASIFN